MAETTQDRDAVERALNVAAQRFYEASGLTLAMTDKPKVVEGLRAALASVGWDATVAEVKRLRTGSEALLADLSDPDYRASASLPVIEYRLRALLAETGQPGEATCPHGSTLAELCAGWESLSPAPVDTEACGAENPEYPGEYACTYPKGHGPVPLDDDHIEALEADHGSPSAGAYWSVEDAPVVPDSTDVRERLIAEALDELGWDWTNVDEPCVPTPREQVEPLVDRILAVVGQGVTAEPVAVVESVEVTDEPVITARVYAPESWAHIEPGTRLYVRPSTTTEGNDHE